MTEYQYVNYAILLERVGHHVFGIRSGFSADQTTDIENAINDGLRDVYSAYDWSFFHPIEPITTSAPYSTGTVEIASGVVTLTDGIFPAWAASGVINVDETYYEVSIRTDDTHVTLVDTSVDADAFSTYELSRFEYDLPTGFEAIKGKLTYKAGQSDFYPPVEFRHDTEIRLRLQDANYTSRPVFFSIRTVEFDPTVGSRRRIAFYPTPDDAYILSAKMTIRPIPIDATNKYPVGGERLSQLIMEACHASAERLHDGIEGIHTKRFQELLPAAILMDQETSSPTKLGPDAPDDETVYISRAMQFGDITLDGDIL